mgnify:CR=1 FL=1
MRVLPAVIAASVVLAFTVPALAEKPDHAGRGRPAGVGGGPHGRGQPAPVTAPVTSPRGSVSIGISIGDQTAMRQYYAQQARSGFCPPGLAKKNNGCLPPGQAKKWAVGYPLAPGIPYYPLPPALLGRLSPAPAGYTYVQVANDVLLMGISTRMIAASVTLF